MFGGISFRADENGSVSVDLDRDAWNDQMVNDVKLWPICTTYKMFDGKVKISFYLTKPQAERLFAELGQCLVESDRMDVERGIKKVFEEGGKS